MTFSFSHLFILGSVFSAMVLPLFFFTFLLPGAVVALNDWSVPCFQGQCSYDIRNGTAGGSVTLVSFAINMFSLQGEIVFVLMSCDEYGRQLRAASHRCQLLDVA